MHERVIRRYQYHGAEQTSDERVVVADDRVLDDVREEQQDDEVERVQLRERALPREVEEDEQRAVDRRRSDSLLRRRDTEVHQVVEHPAGFATAARAPS